MRFRFSNSTEVDINIQGQIEVPDGGGAVAIPATVVPANTTTNNPVVLDNIGEVNYNAAGTTIGLNVDVEGGIIAGQLRLVNDVWQENPVQDALAIGRLPDFGEVLIVEVIYNG